MMPTCMEILRGRRDMLLKESDWTQMPDSPLSTTKKADWATYRQTLRDLPEINPNPTWQDDDEAKLPKINWGTKPGEDE